MSDYKLVPVEPTPEMIDAAAEAYMPFGDMALALQMGIVAAPAVQGAPVAYAAFAENGNIQIWCSDPIQAETLRHQYGDRIKPLYAAPQPAEQQPAPDVAELQAELERERKRRFDGNEQASREHREDMKSLVEALDLALEYWRDRQQRYKNRRPKWVIAAESALAAHRKQGGGA